MILTAGFRSVFVSLLRNTRVSALVSGLNQISHKLAATFWDICSLKCPNYIGYSDSCHFYKGLGLERFFWGGRGGTEDTWLVTDDNLFENPARYITRLKKEDRTLYSDLIKVNIFRVKNSTVCHLKRFLEIVN